jgi:RNA polymerase sigma-70 factor (ECF subfamily)
MDMDAPTDRTLVQRVRSGDAEAFGELVRRYQTAVFNVCLRLVGSRGEAEDLAQEAFLRAYRKLDHYDEARPMRPWLLRLATNVCLNHLSRARHAQVELDERVVQQQTGSRHGQPEQASIRSDRDRAVRAAILELPPRYRAVVELRHFQELRYDEIADALDIPMSDVKSHLYRARKQLAAALKGMADERR